MEMRTPVRKSRKTTPGKYADADANTFTSRSVREVWIEEAHSVRVLKQRTRLAVRNPGLPALKFGLTLS
jgi:hypothetical protein